MNPIFSSITLQFSISLKKNFRALIQFARKRLVASKQYITRDSSSIFQVEHWSNFWIVLRWNNTVGKNLLHLQYFFKYELLKDIINKLYICKITEKFVVWGEKGHTKIRLSKKITKAPAGIELKMYGSQSRHFIQLAID